MRISLGRKPWEEPQSPTGIGTINLSKQVFKQVNGLNDILGWEDKLGRTQTDIENALEKAINACPEGL